MAIEAYNDVQVTVGGTDITDWCTGVTLDIKAETFDATNFGSGGWDTGRRGRKSGTVTLDVLNDYASSASYSILKAAFDDADGEVAMTIKPKDATISATNPEIQFNVLVETFTPIAAKAGQGQPLSMTWKVNSAPVYDVTP